MSGAEPISAEALLLELATSVELAAVCIPPAARQARPQLLEVIRTLAIPTTPHRSGHEDLVCLVGGASLPDTTAPLIGGMSVPFLIVLPAPDDPASAVMTSAALLKQDPTLLARDLPRDRGPVLIATVAGLLDAGSLAGEWRAGAGLAEDPSADGDPLPALWEMAEADRDSVAAIVMRSEVESAQLLDARRALERATREVERLRSSEKQAVERLQAELFEERAWVAEQARRVAASASWRIGHRLTRLGRRLRGRRDRGTNLPEIIAQRMDAADLR